MGKIARMIEMNTPTSEPQTAIDQPGWWAIRHNEGWWVGTEQGVLCYEDFEMARIALTIRWQMDGGGPLHYRIRKFPGPTVAGDEIKSTKTAEQAIIDYESTIQPTDQ